LQSLLETIQLAKEMGKRLG